MSAMQSEKTLKNNQYGTHYFGRGDNIVTQPQRGYESSKRTKKYQGQQLALEVSPQQLSSAHVIRLGLAKDQIINVMLKQVHSYLLSEWLKIIIAQISLFEY